MYRRRRGRRNIDPFSELIAFIASFFIVFVEDSIIYILIFVGIYFLIKLIKKKIPENIEIDDNDTYDHNDHSYFDDYNK